MLTWMRVVFYLCSTSNHNRLERIYRDIKLSFIFVLHQTTTRRPVAHLPFRCLLSLFYIKPQPSFPRSFSAIVVFYLCSTSNHNCSLRWRSLGLLSFIFVLHQTTTILAISFSFFCCLLSLFYIKPQLTELDAKAYEVVFYLCSTSNHNPGGVLSPLSLLSFIFVLHQTTTLWSSKSTDKWLSFIFVLHQTTTQWPTLRLRQGCLLSLFYIKPQLFTKEMILIRVVFYLCSTSNHNFRLIQHFLLLVVFYLCSTSNHNLNMV